jgi:hypothetical protein
MTEEYVPTKEDLRRFAEEKARISMEHLVDSLRIIADLESLKHRLRSMLGSLARREESQL